MAANRFNPSVIVIIFTGLISALGCALALTERGESRSTGMAEVTAVWVADGEGGGRMRLVQVHAGPDIWSTDRPSSRSDTTAPVQGRLVETTIGINDLHVHGNLLPPHAPEATQPEVIDPTHRERPALVKLLMALIDPEPRPRG